jgi:ATP-binding cassette, subfamily C (CFTR/MRP), member 1
MNRELICLCPSGKSTLLLTLLRLLELQSGKIELDGIDIKLVKLDLLRQRCFIVLSQDPLLFPNETLRFNIDPDKSASDDDLIVILAKVGIWSHFTQNAKRHTPGAVVITGFGEHRVLDQKISFFHELSVGQCQLLAFCRALVKAGALRAVGVTPVVLLDEVTSSLDAGTESIIYRIVEEEFIAHGHTVITISHRLGALYSKKGRDAVAIMADGRLLEVGSDMDQM